MSKAQTPSLSLQATPEHPRVAGENLPRLASIVNVAKRAVVNVWWNC